METIYNKKISIICPIYQEQRFISKFLDSIIAQDYPKENLEVFLIDGMSTDGTRDIVKKYMQEYPFFKLLDNPMHTVPFALNNGIRHATGEVVIRLDAHCKYPTHYFSTLVTQLFRLNADNVGGVWHTIPANNTTEALAIAIGSSHPFGVGGSDHKIGTTEIKEVDTVPFGCYRKEVFDKIGLFDEELTRNQDDEFNARLINHGGKIFLIPSVVIDYTARENLAKMRKMYYQYGLFKPLVNKKLGSPATIRQFFPSLFCLGLIVGLLMSIFIPYFVYLYLAIIAIYLILGITIGIQTAIKHRRTALAIMMPYTFLCIHLSYGIGYLEGLYKVLTKQSFNVKLSR